MVVMWGVFGKSVGSRWGLSGVSRRSAGEFLRLRWGSGNGTWTHMGRTSVEVEEIVEVVVEVVEVVVEVVLEAVR